MAEPFVAEIRIFGCNFAPRGWATCDGQLMPISQNTALFSLVGTIYGGDGRTTFALPNLQGRAPMNFGQGPGLTDRQQGEMEGDETVTLTSAQVPPHTHSLMAQQAGRSSIGNSLDPVGNVLAAPATGVAYVDAGNQVGMASVLPPIGGDMPHNNMQPYLTLNFCIALQGIFPSRQ
jgi:microcystin-dependent protein